MFKTILAAIGSALSSIPRRIVRVNRLYLYAVIPLMCILGAPFVRFWPGMFILLECAATLLIAVGVSFALRSNVLRTRLLCLGIGTFHCALTCFFVPQILLHFAFGHNLEAASLAQIPAEWHEFYTFVVCWFGAALLGFAIEANEFRMMQEFEDKHGRPGE